MSTSNTNRNADGTTQPQATQAAVIAAAVVTTAAASFLVASAVFTYGWSKLGEKICGAF